MSVLAVPRRRSGIPKAPKPPEPPPIPGFWDCPECIYRIALDFPNGTKKPIAAHKQAHRFPAEIPLSEEAKSWIRET